MRNVILKSVRGLIKHNVIKDDHIVIASNKVELAVFDHSRAIGGIFNVDPLMTVYNFCKARPMLRIPS